MDGDEAWRTRAAATLHRLGYDVMSQGDGRRLAGLLEDAAPHLVLFSSTHPAEDARLSRLLAQRSPRPRFVVLCPRADLEARKATLTTGADDCVAKPDDPARLADLLVRLLPSASEATGGSDNVLEFAGWRLHALDGLLVAPSGAAKILVAGDLRLLQVFLTHRRQVLSLAQLHRLCGIGARIGDRVLYRRVSRLRCVLGALEPRAAHFIQTRRDEGYVFDCSRVRLVAGAGGRV